MPPLKALDLFCCCGGASKGLTDAGFEVTGVDITDGHEYPYEFVQSDVFKLGNEFLQQFDLIWASPPCQAYVLSNRNKDTGHPALIPQTRALLKRVGRPFIIENVKGAPIREDAMLCGEMFGLKVLRHRYFEVEGFTVLQPKHDVHRLSVKDGTATALWSGGIKPGMWGNRKKMQEYIRLRKYKLPPFDIKRWQEAVGIDWVTKKDHLSQAIPPKYSEYLGRYFKG